MEIEDYDLAKHYLSHISYYRLAGYWWSMQQDKVNHIFKPHSKFESIIDIYNFDSELRGIVFKAIEKIEISFRTKMIYHLSLECSPWWFEDSNLFKNIDEHQSALRIIVSELERSKESFIKEHKDKYPHDSRKPPAWKTLEVVSFGILSKLYGNLKPSVKAKDDIAKAYLTENHTYLHSWVQGISKIRNICAHHLRLWDNNLFSYRFLPKPKGSWLNKVPSGSDKFKLYPSLCCIKYMLNTIDPENSLSNSIISLLQSYPNINIKEIGFSDAWYLEPLWKIS